MTDIEAQICGRISALEYVLEVMLANELSFQPESATRKFLKELVAGDGYIKRGPVDADLLLRIQAETKVSLENFVEKVAQREMDLRRQRAQDR